MAVAFIPPLVDAAVGHGVFDRAIGLVRVSAIGEAAAADVGPHVAVQPGHLLAITSQSSNCRMPGVSTT